MTQSCQVFTVCFEKGDDLKDCLREFVLKNNLSAPFILMCKGTVKSVILSRNSTPKFGPPFPAQEKELTYKKEYFDILSLVGTVSQGGSHLHAVLGRADGTVVGGHLVGNAKVHTTAEVVVGECTTEVYVRKNDPNTTFNELEVVTFDEMLEICLLTGTLAHDGSHLHAVLGRADGSVVAGHVVGDMVVQTTAEYTVCLVLQVVTFDEMLEICSLTGTLAHDGSHLHAVLGRADGSVVAGHVVGDMVVQTTAEVVLGDSMAERYTRAYDPSTSYNELVVSKRQ